MRVAAGLCLWIVFAVWPAAAAEPVRVFAAASLKGALDEAAAKFTAGTKTETVLAFASSSALARQIGQGAPADIFISADLEWMDDAARKDLVDPATRTTLLGNRLVLIAPAASTLRLKIGPGFKLAAELGDGRLAVADPDAVPAGKYAKAALIALQVWPSVEGRLARAENVRAALAFVARGETPLGIVYATDARAEPKVRVVDAFPLNTHPAIVYQAAIVRHARPGAAPFLKFLKGAEARGVFERAGFLWP